MKSRQLGIASLGAKLFCLLLLLACTTTLFGQRSWKKLEEHLVRDNETVYSIAKHYQASVDKVYELNPWAKKSIKAGDKLLIPAGSQSEQTPSVYRIVSGDTLYGVSKRLGISEEELMRANPGITATNFPIGQLLRIPSSAAKPIEEEPTPTIKEEVASQAVYVALLLPITQMPQYLEFYQGLLMALNDLKKVGISINLEVVDTPTDEEVETFVRNGGLTGKDLVIGGINEEQIRMISQANGYGYHIIPFSRNTDLTNLSTHTIQLNNSSNEIINLVVPQILRRYRQYDIYFVRREQDNEDPFVRKLKAELNSSGKGYQTIELGMARTPLYGPNAVLIPVASNKELAQTMLSRLLPEESCTVLGYPQWQAYGDSFIKELHKRNGSIYSTFFFDPEQVESKTFLTKYFAWFNKKVSGSFPKYSVLGYDLARYFIRAWASSGRELISQASLLPKDGLQMDFTLRPLPQSTGYVNTNVYLITFAEDGKIIRENL